MDNLNIVHKHNKKRNAGLLYEFLIRYISNSLIEENDQNTKKALKIFNTYFDKKTEIYKEFRLINSLVNTTIASDLTAANILQEAKNYYKSFDEVKLDREKSLLIREINHKLQDKDFFVRKIPEYKIYATIQNLLNEWKNPKILNIRKMAEYEEAIIKWLNEEKSKPKELEEEHSADIDSLVVKLMSEKLNNRYANILNEEQKNIIKEYVFSLEKEIDKENFKQYLENLKDATVKSINSYLNDTNEQKSETMVQKLNDAVEKINGEQLNEINDVVIERFLKYSQLKQEILSNDANS